MLVDWKERVQTATCLYQEPTLSTLEDNTHKVVLLLVEPQNIIDAIFRHMEMLHGDFTPTISEKEKFSKSSLHGSRVCGINWLRGTQIFAQR